MARRSGRDMAASCSTVNRSASKGADQDVSSLAARKVRSRLRHWSGVLRMGAGGLWRLEQWGRCRQEDGDWVLLCQRCLGLLASVWHVCLLEGDVLAMH